MSGIPILVYISAAISALMRFDVHLDGAVVLADAVPPHGGTPQPSDLNSVPLAPGSHTHDPYAPVGSSMVGFLDLRLRADTLVFK